MTWDKCFTRNEKGFSLVELMIVVGIIGLLATLAVPRFQQFQAKARMAEGKNMLNHLYTLEEAYHLDNNAYLNMGLYGRTAANGLNCTKTAVAGADALGFEINPCGGAVPRFGYTVTGASNNTFTASAATGAAANNLVCPGSAAITYTLNQTKTLTGPNACP